MGKTVAQLGELIYRLVQNGVVGSDNKLTKYDYQHLVFAARDYLLYQRKASGMELTNSHVMSEPSQYKILDGKVVLEKGFCVQGIDSAVLVDGSGEEMPDMILPMSPSGKHLVKDSIFAYYFPNTTYIDFLNLPRKAKKLNVYKIAGSSPNDVVSEDLAFMIIQQIFKLGTEAAKGVDDSSADANGLNDYQKGQVRQMLNQPNQTV